MLNIRESFSVESKRISVSEEGQITLPLKFYDMLNIQKEVECFIQNGAIVIKPIHETPSSEFAEVILQDLISQDLSGNELLEKFKQLNKKIRPAVEKLIIEADELAKEDTKRTTFNEIFGLED